MANAAQIRMARAALGWSVRELSDRSGVAASTILRFETGKGGMQTGTLERIESALAKGGVMFTPADSSGGVGVRFKK